MSKPSDLKAGEFLLYETEDRQSRNDVRMDSEAVWISLNQQGNLFGRDKAVLARRLKNVFDHGTWKKGDKNAP